MRSFLLIFALLLVACAPPRTSPFLATPYTTPAALAAAPCTVAGAPAWVQWQGRWVCQPACPCTPDGVTCVAATGGGCWAREGADPGTNGIAAWYVDALAGDDANTCVSAGAAAAPGGDGACRTIDEPYRRVGAQPLAGVVPIYLHGDQLGSHTLVGPSGPGYFDWTGEATPVPGALFQVTSTVPWGTWGSITLGSYGGGALFASSAWAAAGGYAFEDLDQCSGGACLLVQIGPALDAATFASPGGIIAGVYAPAWPSVGDRLQVVTLTGISTDAGSVLTLGGEGFLASSVVAGNGYHTVEIAVGPGWPNSVEFDGSILNGADIFEGSVVYLWGTATTNGVRAYGYLASDVCYHDGLEDRADGYLVLNGPTLIGLGGISVGMRDGPGSLWVGNGPTAVEGYEDPCLSVGSGATAILADQLTCHNSAVGQPAIAVVAGVVDYSVPPDVGGVMPSGAPFVVGSASAFILPLTSGLNGIQLSP